MESKEFNLSEILFLNTPGQSITPWDLEKVKEFIKRLKDNLELKGIKFNIFTWQETREELIKSFKSVKNEKGLLKELKRIINACNICKEIDKLAGEELVR